jgi:hypothetical protein
MLTYFHFPQSSVSMLVSYCVLGKWTQFHSAYEATVSVITESMQDYTESLLEILNRNTTSINGMDGRIGKKI